MRRGRVFIYLALILLVGLAGAFLFLRSRSASEEAAAPAPALVDIVIAQQNIPQGAKITEEVLGKISLPEGTDFGVMFRYDQRGEQLVGKIAKYPIEPGVVITTPMICRHHNADDWGSRGYCVDWSRMGKFDFPWNDGDFSTDVALIICGLWCC